MTTAQQFVPAEDYNKLRREHEELREAHRRLHRATSDVQAKSYQHGRDDARREDLRDRVLVRQGIGDEVVEPDFNRGLAHLTIPDNGGAIQFHVVGPSGHKPLVGGILSPEPDYSLSIWGPPDGGNAYGIHEQGGGNMTDFSMAFDLTAHGIEIYRMDIVGVRTRWDRET